MLYHIIVKYKGEHLQFGVRAYEDHGRPEIHHEIWQDGNYIFTIVPNVNDLVKRWKDKNTLSAVDDELIAKIGAAIEAHDE